MRNHESLVALSSEVVVLLDSLAVRSTEDFEASDVLAFEFDADIVVGWEKGVVEIFE